jgi:hypothetical protein
MLTKHTRYSLLQHPFKPNIQVLASYKKLARSLIYEEKRRFKQNTADYPNHHVASECLQVSDVTTKNSNTAGSEFFDEFSDESNYNKDPDYYDA